MMLVEQINQFGFIFWMLLAMYCFVRAWDSKRWWVIGLLTGGDSAITYHSLGCA